MEISDKVEKIKKIGEKVKPQAPLREPNKDYFDELMRQRNVKTDAVKAQKTEELPTDRTLMDEVRELNHRVNQATKASPDSLVAQAEDVIAKIEEVKKKLQTPELKIRKSEQTILRSKLTHIDESLKLALSKVGVEYAPPVEKGFAKPIDRFLSLLTHGQSQLETLAQNVQAFHMKRGQLNPADMLLIQIKVAFITQEIELFTSMLNKALESTKTIMNVQV